MKRVCFLVPNASVTNGITRVVRNLAEHLGRLDDWNVTLLAAGAKNGEEFRVSQAVNLVRLNVEKHGKLSYYIRVMRMLRRHFRMYSYDYCIVAGMEYVIPLWIAAHGQKMKLLAWEHLHFYSCPKFRLEWWGKRLAIRQFAGIITITKRDYEQYKKQRGEAPIFQVYNVFSWENGEGEYDIESKTIVSVQSINYIKGYDMLLEVAKEVFTRCPDWKWDVYGVGDAEEHLKKMISENHLEDNMSLKGFVSDMNQRYSDYGIFVLTSRKEGMGMVMIEAQLAHLPVVSFDILCGPSDIIVDGENGYLIPPFDIDLMAERIVELIQRKELRQKFSERTCIRHRELQEDFIVDRWLHILESIEG